MHFYFQNIMKLPIKIGSRDESSTAYSHYTCCFNNAYNSSKFCTSYVGTISLLLHFFSGLNQQVSIPATYPPFISALNESPIMSPSSGTKLGSFQKHNQNTLSSAFDNLYLQKRKYLETRHVTLHYVIVYLAS